MSGRADRKKSPCPLRTCLGCRQVKPQAALKRLALVDGQKGAKVIWDEERRQGGRGAWLCRDEGGCLAAAVKRRAFSRAFKCGDLDLAELGSEGLIFR